MKRILTVALNPAVDLSGVAHSVKPIHKIRTTGERQDPGGGGINVARVVTTLGGQAEAMFLAGGETGDLLDGLLGNENIRRTRVPIAGRTRISFTVWEESTGLEYRFVPEGPRVRDEELEPCLSHVAACDCDYVVASGSLPPGVAADIYVRMAKMAEAKGARFVLDSSGEGLKATLDQARVFLVTPSCGELEQLVGRKLDEAGMREAACQIVDRGAAKLVVVTMGSGGALLASAAGVLRLPAIRVEIRSAVGAGDSFLAAMTLALAQGKPAETAFQLGIAAGAAAVMTPGTELCRREDVDRLFAAMGSSAEPKEAQEA